VIRSDVARVFALVVAAVAARPPAAGAAEYRVGDGQPYRSLGAVPWARLAPGDTVQVHWRKEPYREKLMLVARGTAERPIHIVGVPGRAGEPPVIDGTNATTSPQFNFPYPPTQDRGVIIVTPDRSKRWGYKPGYLTLEGLEVRGGYRGNEASPNTYTDFKGTTRSYSANAAAVFVERGEHITIRNCIITNSGNGLFVASGGSEEVQSRDILVEGCHIFGNGNVGRDREHNVYTEAIGITFQYNWLGRPRPGSGGNNLKDRSAGTVLRYNWVEGGAHLLDLVEPQESAKITTKDPSFRKTFVYGNVLLDGPDDATRVVHYGGDNGAENIYRKGTLYFYNNTVIVRGDQRKRYRTILFQLATNDETVDVRNNIIYREAATPTGVPTELSLLENVGTANCGVNWVSPGWLPVSSGAKVKGTITGTEKYLGDRQGPQFVRAESDDFHLAVGSPCVGRAEPLPPELAKLHPVKRQYVAHQKSEPRTAAAGEVSDLGALAFARSHAGR
jgi:hypothetical protein